MPKICYVQKKFNAEHQRIIDKANAVIATFSEQGFDLTLRQLYYQFIAQDFFANKSQNYDRLGVIISDARRAGLVDWSAIVDRTRNLQEYGAWDSPADIIRENEYRFDVERWHRQPTYVEFWIEKDALLGVLAKACGVWRARHFSCRGYVSDSEAWAAGVRLRERLDAGQQVKIFHLGDHDPSGIDMSRDIRDRLRMFAEDDSEEIEVERIALNMSQVEQYNPPPNPAKTTDCRYADYAAKYGEESWELDALDPRTLTALVETAVESVLDDDICNECEEERKSGRAAIRKASVYVKGLAK